MLYVKKAVVLTSGADAPGMNAAIRAVIQTGIAAGWEMYGARHGFQGLVENSISRLDSIGVNSIIHRPGTVLDLPPENRAT